MAYDQAMVTSPQSSTSSEALLAPGFRFHPTDEELVSYYLKRKICGKKFRFDAISEVDVYKVEPWDLPGKSKLKSKDLEWYFFSGLDKKYGSGARTNRATEKGYWKTTGKDREVSHKSQVVGMKKTLVYHEGRAPKGQRTNWVMHEYKLMDRGLAKAGIHQDAFVLCRIFQKSGLGPKNGEKYGAPLVEEEWEADELVVAPAKEVVEQALVTDDNDIYLDSSDLEQIFDGKIPTEYVPVPLNICYGDAGSQVQEIPVETSDHVPKQEHENQPFSVTQMQNQVCMDPEFEQFVVESDNSVNDLDFLLDQPFFDAEANGLFDDVAFLETDDFLNSVNRDRSGVDMLDEYLNFFGEDQGKNSQYMAFDPPNMVGNENLFVNQEFFNSKLADGQAEQEISGNQQLLQGLNNNDAFMSAQNHQNVKSGGQFSFIQKASNMLGGISAPPALASEFPIKESALRLVTGSTSSVHLTAGMIQIQKPKSNGTQTSFVLSLGLCHNNADNSLSFEPSVSGVLTKAMSALSRSFMYLMFFWVTYRVGSFFCSGNVSS